MRVSTRVEQSPSGKQYVLSATIEGRVYEARHVWPEAYNYLDKKAAMAVVERNLWYLLMGTIEGQLKGTASGET